MKKQFAKLSKAQQQKVEAEYHRMQPNEFDSLMSQAKHTKRVSHSSSRSAPKRKSKAAEKRPAA